MPFLLDTPAEDGGRFYIGGPARAGKSTILKQLFRHFKTVYPDGKITLVSKSAQHDEIWEDKESAGLIDYFFPDATDDAFSHIRSLMPTKTDTPIPGRHMVAFDDMGDSTRIKSARVDNPAQDLATAAVQNGIFLVHVVHRMAQVNTVFRDNAEVVIAPRLRTRSQVKQFTEEFLGSLAPENAANLLSLAWREPFDFITIQRMPGGREIYTRNGTEELRTPNGASNVALLADRYFHFYGNYTAIA